MHVQIQVQVVRICQSGSRLNTLLFAANPGGLRGGLLRMLIDKHKPLTTLLHIRRVIYCICNSVPSATTLPSVKFCRSSHQPTLCRCNHHPQRNYTPVRCRNLPPLTRMNPARGSGVGTHGLLRRCGVGGVLLLVRGCHPCWRAGALSLLGDCYQCWGGVGLVRAK